MSDRSRVLAERALRYTPGGVHSNVRLAGPRAFVDRAEGAWLWDVDGNDYIDYLLGQGPNFLGHSPGPVRDAVAVACQRGVIYGGQHALELEAAEAVCSALGWADQVRFGVSGTESVHAALRLARAATRRAKVIRFEGHYHGWLDSVLMTEHDRAWGIGSAGQLPRFLEDYIVLPWNDIGVVSETLNQAGHDIAALIMEPMMLNAGAIEPLPGYLEQVRELCTTHGVVLVFDEVISGFRLALGGAAERFGVTPDLATYGKAMAGGWPVSALAGRRELMRLFGTGEVTHAGTFNGSVMAMAAVAATLSVLRSSPPYDRLDEFGKALMSAIEDLGAKHDLPIRVQGLPIAFHVSFGIQQVIDYRTLQRLDLARYRALAAALVEHGIWVSDRGIWYVSAAHGQKELDTTVARFVNTLRDWQ